MGVEVQISLTFIATMVASFWCTLIDARGRPSRQAARGIPREDGSALTDMVGAGVASNDGADPSVARQVGGSTAPDVTDHNGEANGIAVVGREGGGSVIF